MRPLDRHIRSHLNESIAEIGKTLGDVDTMSIISPIVPGVDEMVRLAIDMKKVKKPAIAVILKTPGGVVEVVERMVEVIRKFYTELVVIVPDQAMSAGTVFALSADRVLMDHFSILGPIDPQIVKDGKLIPALAYLKQYELLNKKAKQGDLSTAEYVMLNKLDPGELYQFEQARELSIELLREWLSTYKFKGWKKTETEGKPVTQKMKRDRATAIAEKLSDVNRWHSHGRGINISTLRKELNLKIEDYSENELLNSSIQDYYDLLIDYLGHKKLRSFIHTEEYFSYE